jgi:glutathione S-transferase
VAGSASDEQKIAAALPIATICLSALAELMGNRPWLTGSATSLTDLHAAPMFAVFRLAPEGERLLNRERRLADWWHRMSNRPSFARTQALPRHASGLPQNEADDAVSAQPQSGNPINARYA